MGKEWTATDGHNEEAELDKRGVSPEDVFNPKVSITLREFGWETVLDVLDKKYKQSPDDDLKTIINHIIDSLEG